MATETAVRVTVWNEGVHEKRNPEVQAIYPEGIGACLAAHLRQQPGIASARSVGLDDPEQGLSDEVLDGTDVLAWWGHLAHNEVTDENAARVCERVRAGMGLVVLHSGHHSKVFRALMGTSCDLRWRDNDGKGEKERLWVVDPAHPIAEGLPPHFELPRAEMYGEHFDIPPPEQLVFISWFQGGDVFRSGACWSRGQGKIFYFRPGHETFPIYRDPVILRVIANGVRWAAPTRLSGAIVRENAPALEPLD